MDKKGVMKKACGKGGPGPTALRAMQQSNSGPVDLTGYKAPSPFQMIGSAVKSVTPKVVKSGISGAINAYNANLANDKKVLGFNDPGSYLGAAAKGILGGAVGAAKEFKNEITPQKKGILQKAVKGTSGVMKPGPTNGIKNRSF